MLWSLGHWVKEECHCIPCQPYFRGKNDSWLVFSRKIFKWTTHKDVRCVKSKRGRWTPAGEARYTSFWKRWFRWHLAQREGCCEHHLDVLTFSMEHSVSLRASFTVMDGTGENGLGICGALHCNKQVSLESWSLPSLQFNCTLMKGVIRAAKLEYFAYPVWSG